MAFRGSTFTIFDQVFLGRRIRCRDQTAVDTAKMFTEVVIEAKSDVKSLALVGVMPRTGGTLVPNVGVKE